MTSHSGSTVNGTEAGFRKTRTENYGFIGDKTILDSYAAAHCDLTLLPVEFYKAGFGIAFPKGWPYTEYFNDVYVFTLAGSKFNILYMCNVIFVECSLKFEIRLNKKCAVQSFLFR